MINTSFWLSKTTHDKLMAQAKRDGRSRNAQVLWLFANGTAAPVEDTATGAAAFINVSMTNSAHEAAKARAAQNGVTITMLLRHLINGTE